MEAKKNPKYDVHRQRGMLFSIGLIVSISLVITAFKWRTAVEKEPDPYSIEDQTDLYPVPSTDHLYAEAPPKPSSPSQAVQNQSPLSNNIVEVNIEEIMPTDITILTVMDLDAELANELTIKEAIPTEPAVDQPFIFVEEMPEPVDGFLAFYKNLGKRIHYPASARRMHIEGKVFVQFIVNEEGELTDFQVIRGISADCDAEAIRIFKQVNRWKPGKQRGIPVKVKMVQPITFSLQ